jgi:hypothetical protein
MQVEFPAPNIAPHGSIRSIRGKAGKRIIHYRLFNLMMFLKNENSHYLSFFMISIFELDVVPIFIGCRWGENCLAFGFLNE